jgi:iron complex transport system substrate-binding protein
MRRIHAALLAVLVVGVVLGGTGVAGGIGAGVTDSEQTGVHPWSQQLGDHQNGSTGLACSYPVEVTDATGETVVVEEEPEEVVALGASDAQVLWELGAEAKVTGLPMTGATAYLEDRETLPDGENRTDISGDFGPVVEKVVGVEADLVLGASAMFPDDIEAIRDAGQTVYYAESEATLDDVYSYVEQLGQLVNACDAAEETVADMQETVGIVEEAVAGEDTPSMFYAQVPGEGWTAGAGTVEEDIITTAGGENVGSELGVEFYEQVTEEALLDADPDWILTAESRVSQVEESLSELTAVQEGRIITVDENAISQPGPRMVEPLEAIAEALHPEALADARNPDNGTDDGTDDGSDDGTDDGSDDGTDDGSDDGTDDGSDDGTDDGTDDDGMDDGSDDSMDDDGMDSDNRTDGDDGGDATDDDADGDGTGLTVVAALVALSALVLAARRHADS